MQCLLASIVFGRPGRFVEIATLDSVRQPGWGQRDAHLHDVEGLRMLNYAVTVCLSGEWAFLGVHGVPAWAGNTEVELYRLVNVALVADYVVCSIVGRAAAVSALGS